MLNKIFLYLCLNLILLLGYFSNSFALFLEDLTLNKKFIQKHPRLFIDQQKIEFIKSKLNQYPYSKFWRYIQKKAYKYAKQNPPISVKKYNNNSIRGLGNKLPYMAIAYLLSGNNIYLRGVKKWMRALCSYPNWASNKDLGAAHILLGMAIAYDWLYDKFTPEEKALYRKTMIYHTDILYNLFLKKKIWWSKTLLQNHNYVNTLAIAAVGVALYGETKKATKYLEATHENFLKILKVLPPDGSWHEGVPYWNYAIWALLLYSDIEQKVWNYNPYKMNTWFKNTIYFRLYSSLPSWEGVVNFSDTGRFKPSCSMHILRRLASIFNNGYAQWLAEYLLAIEGKRTFISWLDMLWYDPNVKPIPPFNLPLYRYFPDGGLLFWRNSWDKDAIFWMVKVGPPLGFHVYKKHLFAKGAGHDHPDIGHFTLYAYGKHWILDDGYAYIKKTENHNVLIVDRDKCEQYGSGLYWLNAGAFLKGKAKVKIVAKDINEKYAFLVVDLTHVYKKFCGFKKYYRYFLLLKNGVGIIIDKFFFNTLSYVKELIHIPKDSTVKLLLDGIDCEDDGKGFRLYKFHSKEKWIQNVEPYIYPIRKKGYNIFFKSNKLYFIENEEPIANGYAGFVIIPYKGELKLKPQISHSENFVKVILNDLIIDIDLLNNKVKVY